MSRPNKHPPVFIIDPTDDASWRTSLENGRGMKLSLEVVLHQVVKSAVKLTEADEGYLLLVDDASDDLYLRAQANLGEEEARDFRVKVDHSIAGKVVQTGEPVTLSRKSNSLKVANGLKVYSLVNVPVKVGEEVIGVLGADNRRQKRAFTRDDQELLAALADWAAIAIQNARLYTALKQANEALHQAQMQRLAAERWAILGQAAGSLAHRINNSTALVPIAAQHLRELLQQVKMAPDLKKEVDDNLSRIERNTLYTIDLAAALLHRFRQNPSETHNVNELVKQALEQVKIPKNIKVKCDLDPNLPAVNTSDLLADVFVELMTNAVRAIGAKDGLVQISSFHDDNNVFVQVIDNGPGIPEENAERIFDLFYTTNPGGLGFGLWWIKVFLEQQRGEITVESRPNEGATFTVTLPRNPPPLPSGKK